MYEMQASTQSESQDIGWNHARFMLACSRANITRPADLMRAVNEYRRARGNPTPFDRRTAARYFDGSRGDGIEFRVVIELADMLGVSTDWLGGRDDVTGEKVSA